MLVSFVLRLRDDQLASGRLVGEVEHVETAVTYPLRSTADLVECCRRAAAAPGRPRGDNGR